MVEVLSVGLRLILRAAAAADADAVSDIDFHLVTLLRSKFKKSNLYVMNDLTRFELSQASLTSPIWSLCQQARRKEKISKKSSRDDNFSFDVC